MLDILSGWSSKIGHKLKKTSKTKLNQARVPKCTIEFAEAYATNETASLLWNGRVFECVHPLRLNKIVPAKIG